MITISIIVIIGANQSFFRNRKKVNSSLRNPIPNPIFKIDFQTNRNMDSSGHESSSRFCPQPALALTRRAQKGA